MRKIIYSTILFITVFLFNNQSASATTTITRGELAAHLTDAFNLTLVNPSTPTFSDVPASHPQYKQIETLYANTITSGCGTNPLRFCPDGTSTRQEIATFLVRLLKLNVVPDTYFKSFNDISGTPLESYLRFADQIGILSPCDANNNFCPNSPITDTDLASFVDKAHFIKPDRPQRWIQPNFHPDKVTIWETVYSHPELWDNTFKNVDVLGLFIYSIDANPQGYLDKVAAIVKKYNLKINVELYGPMQVAGCDSNRGFESGREIVQLIKPIYDRGIKVDYLSLDGSGMSLYTCQTTSGLTWDQLYQWTVDLMKTVHQTYPDIKFGILPNIFAWRYVENPPLCCNVGGDTHPENKNLADGDFAKRFDELVNKVNASGEKIYYVLTDSLTYHIGISEAWARTMVRLENQVERKGITYGALYYSPGGNDGNWYTDLLNIKKVYEQKQGSPGIQMIESFGKSPITFVPDYASYTFTNLVSDFFGFPHSAKARNITRGEVASDLAKYFNWTLVNQGAPTFSDVPTNSPYYKQIETMYVNKVTTGCGDSPLRFCPDNQLTRAEAITFLLRAANIAPDYTGGVQFGDVPQTHPLFNFVMYASQNGISSGCNPSAGFFCPDETIDLGEWETLATKVLDIYYSTKTCPLITRCSTFIDGQTVSYYPDPRNGCYDFAKFPVYPLVSASKGISMSCPGLVSTKESCSACPGSFSSGGQCTTLDSCVCRQAKPTCTIQQGLGGQISSVPGDLNADGKVDIFDYNLLVGNFGKTESNMIGDIDKNGKVDIFDYNDLVGNFGK